MKIVSTIARTHGAALGLDPRASIGGLMKMDCPVKPGNDVAKILDLAHAVTTLFDRVVHVEASKAPSRFTGSFPRKRESPLLRE